MTLKNKLTLILYQTIKLQSDASTGQFCKSTIYLPLKANRNSDADHYNLMSQKHTKNEEALVNLTSSFVNYWISIKTVQVDLIIYKIGKNQSSNFGCSIKNCILCVIVDFYKHLFDQKNPFFIITLEKAFPMPHHASLKPVVIHADILQCFNST